jgi:hypothetical protein
MSWPGPEGETRRIGEHAVVLGASIGGLLAARVLADFYERVTVVDRDLLPKPQLIGGGFRRAATSTIYLGVVRRSWANFSPESSTSSSQPERPSMTTKIFRDGP